MFEEFAGIPMHPLLVHAAVVFVPLLALGAIAYGFVPRLRAHLRLVLAGLAVVTPGAAWFAERSGKAFFERGVERKQITEGFVPVIERHQELGEMMAYFTTGLGVLTLVLVYLVAPHVSAAVASGPAWRTSPALKWAVSGLTAVVAVISVYYVIRTGDSGAHAVWEGR